MLFLASLLLPAFAAEVPDVQVVALFQDAAMVRTVAGEKLLKVGESHEGIELVSATSRAAVLRVGDREFELGISERIASSYSRAEKASVSIAMNNRGQYVTRGAINNRSVEFLVDTGANIIAMNTPTARALGIDYMAGRLTAGNTAGGVVAARAVTLETVEVGGIRASNVEAVVLPGDSPPLVLLGMSFLQHVEIRESGGLLQLTAEF